MRIMRIMFHNFVIFNNVSSYSFLKISLLIRYYTFIIFFKSKCGIIGSHS